jgi:putative nucleotidyltransferase with HDIG domain
MGMSDLLKLMKESWTELYLHSTSVANLTLRISTLLRLDEVEQETAIAGAFLHDVEKMFVRREIIEKPGPLTEEEWIELKEHIKRGASVVAARRGDNSLVEIIRYHHEW